MMDDPSEDSEDPPLTPEEHPTAPMTGDQPTEPMGGGGRRIESESTVKPEEEAAAAWKKLQEIKEQR